jgi:anhydro-N-acetylmuramic acid kinase
MAEPMRVLGLMSGTSADGIEVALVEISGAPPRLKAKLEAHNHVRFPSHVREAILRLANGAPTSTAEISELNFRLGAEFGEAAVASCKKWGIPLSTISLAGSHGQTVFHLGKKGVFKGKARAASTLQIGDISVIAQRTGVTTIGDFRPADMAAGGQGAPLVPFVDYLLYQSDRVGRAALNIGGIANVTVIPAGARPSDVFAFDTGPGNMIVDTLMESITRGKAAYDKDARFALTGKVIPALLAKLMREPYLRKKPPKSAGREQFGADYAHDFFKWGAHHRAAPADLVRTATVFTALSICDAFCRLILPRANVKELIVAGGGTENPLMMAQLATVLPGIEIVPSSRFGVPSDAKEAFAFALLAYETYHGRANNLPSATGAKHAVVLGKIAAPALRKAATSSHRARSSHRATSSHRAKLAKQ